MTALTLDRDPEGTNAVTVEVAVTSPACAPECGLCTFQDDDTTARRFHFDTKNWNARQELRVFTQFNGDGIERAKSVVKRTSYRA